MPDPASNLVPGDPAGADSRLRELADQTLHLLDELATARAQAAGAEAWKTRCAELLDRLEETRRHVRASRITTLSGGGPAASSPSLEVFLWVPADVPQRDRDAWLGRLRRFCKKVPARLLCRADAMPSAELRNVVENLGVLETEATTPAGLWNQALAASQAQLVLFLACGSLPETTFDASELAGLADETVALGQPVLTLRGKDASLGLVAQRGLVLEAGAAPRESTGWPELEFAAPEAFCVQRASNLRLGPFDEDLRGTLALAEYALRARARGYLTLGLPAQRVDLLTPPGRSDERMHDTLITLARHRPGEVSTALVRAKLLWELPEPQVRPFLHAVFARLPQAAQWPEGLRILVEELAGVVTHTIATPVLEVHLRQMEQTLHSALGIAPPLPAGKSFAPQDALQRKAEKLRSLVARLDAVEAEISLERTRRQSAERAQAEREQQLTEQAAALTALRTELERAGGWARDLEQQARAHAARAGELAAAIASLDAERAQLARRLDAEQREAATREAAHTAATARLADEGARLRTELEARERWIARLLRELTARGLKLRRRQLTADEQHFLDSHGGA